jgi:cytochrome c oxidase cbb3-type subunit I
VTTAPARPDPWPDSQRELDIRRRADASSRRPALLAFTTALAWLLAGSLFGDVASLKLHLPDWLVTHGWLTSAGSASRTSTR